MKWSWARISSYFLVSNWFHFLAFLRRTFLTVKHLSILYLSQIVEYQIKLSLIPEKSSKTMVKKVIGLNHIFLHIPNIHQFEVFWRISNNIHYCFIVMQIAIDFDVVKRHFYLFQMFNCKWFQWQLRIESQFFCFSKMFWNSSSLRRHSCEWFRVIYLKGYY